MKRILFGLALFAFVGCSDSGTGGAGGTDTNNAGGSTPTAIDTTQHATGITNQNVISTDTAAMRVTHQNADSVR